MYAEIRDKLASVAKPFLNTPPLRAVQFSVDFQPLPSAVGAISASKGGNAMGLGASDPERIILIFQGAWNFPQDDELAYGLAREVTEWLDQVVPEWVEEAGMEMGYMPDFMNDAMGDQNVMASYAGYDRFKALQREVDPLGLWSGRAGGFKY
jgi:hypothetical protein